MYQRGVSFSQVARLIESIGLVGKIDDFTIKPMEQHSFLMAGFSRYTSSQPSSGEGTVSTAEVGRIHRNTTRTRPQDGRAVDAGALASRSEPSSSDDGGLSDSDPESSSDDDGMFERGRAGLGRTSEEDLILLSASPDVGAGLVEGSGRGGVQSGEVGSDAWAKHHQRKRG